MSNDLAPLHSVRGVSPEKSGGTTNIFTATSKATTSATGPKFPYRVPAGAPDITQLDPSTLPPRNQNEARKSVYWPHYFAAEQLEIDTLNRKHVWELVDSSQKTPGAKVLRGRWVYALKKKDGKVTHAKARYTVMGNFQTEGVDYHDTFASVMNVKSFRTLIALANLDPTFTMEHWDITAAYTNADNDPRYPVFAEQPPGHRLKGNKFNKILKLLKALYGQKNAGHLFQQHLKQLLKRVGCRVILVDTSLYLIRRNEAWCILATYVDDIFPCFNQNGKALRDIVWNDLSTKMDIRNEGELSWALNTKIDRDKEKGITKISQEAFVWEMLSRFGMLNINSERIANTPADPRVKLPPPDTVSEEEVAEMKEHPSERWLVAFCG